jgi:hypothetical protein
LTEIVALRFVMPVTTASGKDAGGVGVEVAELVAGAVGGGVAETDVVVRVGIAPGAGPVVVQAAASVTNAPTAAYRNLPVLPTPLA